MTTYTVSNTNASGGGSLAAALASARDDDTIQFAVSGTITLAGNTALPSGLVTFNTTDAAGTAHDVTITGGAFTDAAGSTSGLGKEGFGTLTLEQDSSYSGETDFIENVGPFGVGSKAGSLGTLRAGSAGAFSLASQVVFNSGDADEVGTLDLGGFDETVGGLIAQNVHFEPDLIDYVTNSGPTPATLTIAAAGPSTTFTTQDNGYYNGYGHVFDGIIQDGDPSQGGSTLSVDVAGNLNLAKASTYTGGTTIERGGTLTLLSETAGSKIGSAMGFGSVVGAITDDGTLDIVAVAYGSSLNPITVTNAISGSGGVDVTVDAAEADLDGLVILTGHSTYTGATLIEHGTLRGGVADAFSPNSAVTVNGNTFGHGATLDLGGNAQGIGSLAGDSGGIITNGGAAAVLTVGGGDGTGTFFGTIRDGAGALALVKVGAGTEVLAGTDSYSGGTTVEAGTLEFASDAALPPGAIAFAGEGATLRLDAAPADGSTFADPLSDFTGRDALDLQGFAFAPGATATVSGNRLAVTSGATTAYFTLAGSFATKFSVTADAVGGTLITGTGPSVAGLVDVTTNLQDAMRPFASATVSDPEPETLDSIIIAPSGSAGTLAGAGLVANPDGTYTLAFATPQKLSQELDALTFTPAITNDGPLEPTTFALSLISSTGATGAAAVGYTVDSDPNQGDFGTTTTSASTPQGEVYALYQGLLGRAPDPTGGEQAVADLQAGAPIDGFTQGLLASPEASSFFLPGSSDGDFVDQLYERVLGRTETTDEQAYWDRTLQQGASRAQVADDFVFSTEHLGDIQPALSQGVFIADAATSEVARLYYGLLDRSPEASGLQANTQQLGVSGSLTALAHQTFLDGGEYAADNPTLPSDQAFVNALFENALGRVPEQGAGNFWTQQLDSGAQSRAQVAVGITESAEAQQHLAGRIEAGYHIA